MASTTDLIHSVTHYVLSHHISSYFVNGAPGSGKSTLLRTLKKELPTALDGTYMLGPYKVDPQNLTGLMVQIANDCIAGGYLEEPPSQGVLDGGYTVFWQWMYEHLESTQGQNLFILLDVLSAPGLSHAPFFSAIRSLSALLSKNRVRLHHLLTGYWDHAELERFFSQRHVSFPYTPQENYSVWTGFNVEEIASILPPQAYRELKAKLLEEVCGGHASALAEILKHTGGDLTLPKIQRATIDVSAKSASTEALLAIWETLPTTSRELIGELLVKRYVSLKNFYGQAQILLPAGLIKLQEFNDKTYVSFRSWYVELIVRQHLDIFCLSDKIYQINILDLVPEIKTYNEAAYSLIYELETTVRNFASKQLHLYQHGEQVSLAGWVERTNERTSELEDLEKRCKAVLKKQNYSGQSLAFEVLISCCTTSDLATLLKEMAEQFQINQWQQLGEQISKLVAIRNAVMHSQLITDSILSQLYIIREEIYSLMA